MTTPENRPNVQLSSNELIDELARIDERSAADDAGPSDVDSTVRSMKADLDTLAYALCDPSPVGPFEDESDCRRAIDLVAAIGKEPSFNVSEKQLQTADEPSELGFIGQYKLLAKLGAGGMGTVYKALHPSLKRVVALKVLPADRMQNADAVGRFQREMEAVGRLDHQNIVRATDAGEIDGTHFLVMEHVDGIDLSDLVRQQGPLPIPAACEIVRQAAVGLQHAHEHGLVHRDIKPSNLMLTMDGRVKLL
ncbi:MAG: serine/threonine protein kinase, partial [Planctomycetes bacterium]|nr:serine/threonine protein kinase [Planctomycetota bacterium]